MSRLINIYTKGFSIMSKMEKCDFEEKKKYQVPI